MASIERRIRQLEDRSHAGEEPGGREEREKRRRDFLEKLQSIRAKAESEERMGDPRRRRALDELEESIKRRRGLSDSRNRIKRLEAAQKQEEAQLGREALTYLSDEELVALEDVLEAGQEDGTATFEDLYRVVKEQGRRALESYFDCLEALREGENRSPLPNPERRG